MKKYRIKNKKAWNGLAIHTSYTGLEESPRRRSFINYFLLSVILCLGILGMLLYQQIQNIGMIIGLLPITGITLPMISYGGSSLLSYLIAFGIIMNASAKAKKLSDYVYE